MIGVKEKRLDGFRQWCFISGTMRPDRAHKVETNLVLQQEVFQRAYTSLLNGLKYTEKKTIDGLKGSNAETELNGKKEEENLRKSLLAIAMVIQKLKHNIRNENFVENHDTDYFKRHITSIEENLTAFKILLGEQLQTLQEEEIDLQQSIDSLNQRWNETSVSQSENLLNNTVRIRAKSKIQSQINENVHPDVQEFHQFLRSHGGHTGGWDSKDHVLFTRFLHKYHGLDQMTTALLDFMPDKTPEEIAQHESWYHDYLTLKDAQRRALKDWRCEQTQKQKCGTENESIDSTSITNKMPNQRDPSVKEKIKIWKEKQEKQRQQQLHDLQVKKQQEEDAWKKKVAYFEQQRRIIAEKHKEQQMPMKGSNYQESDDSSIPRKHIPLKEFWEQDKLYMQRRQWRMQRFSASPRQRSSSQSTVKAERDPARLLRSTAVWRARTKRSLSEEGERQSHQYKGLYIVDVPRLAIPKWREGIV